MLKTSFVIFILFVSNFIYAQKHESQNPFLGEWQYVTEEVFGSDTVHFPLHIIYKFKTAGLLELTGKMVKTNEKRWAYSFTSDSLFVKNKSDSLKISYSLINPNLIRLHHIVDSKKVYFLFVKNNEEGLSILKNFHDD